MRVSGHGVADGPSSPQSWNPPSPAAHIEIILRF
jgi:hypothetical protein